MDVENTVMTKLDAGEVVFGAGVETGSPKLVEAYGAIGLDWVWVDFEHKNRSPYDSDYLEQLVRAAECANTELIVRVPQSDPALIRKVLDAGVRNILVPRVTTADEVRRVVAASRFEYDGQPGQRGLGFGRSCAYGDFMTNGTPAGRYDRAEDANTLIGLLIEEREALANLDAILDVPDVGFVLPGPGDLSVQLGHPLEYDHPDVVAAVDRIREGCVDRDIPVQGVFGSHFSTTDEVGAAIENGYQLVGLGNEFDAVRTVFGDRLDSVIATSPE